MKLKGSIPREAASLLILRPCPASSISFFNYDVLVLQRHQKMSFGSAVVFPGGKVEKETDENYRMRYLLSNRFQSAALRQTFEETGLFFSGKPIIESQKLSQLSKIRMDYIGRVFNNVEGAKEKSYEELSQLLTPTTRLIPFIRMITIPLLKSRFDTTFFVLPLEEYKYVNFFKYAEHEKHLHKMDQIEHCNHQYTNFRWMNPAQILHEHFHKKSVVPPPQFIMLNIMLRFQQYSKFLNFLQTANLQQGNNNQNLGPNIISLVPNKGEQAEKYPYSATLVGDQEFPYRKILENESCQQLKREVEEWSQKAVGEGSQLNRFLFRQSKGFFDSQYEVVCNVRKSVIGEMRGWEETRNTVNDLIL